MANLMDYMDWRGDLPCSSVPFGEVDYLIFSKMTYVDLLPILPEYGSGGTMLLGEAARRYRAGQAVQKQTMGVLVPAEIPDMFLKMGQCERYRNLLLSDYINTIDVEQQEQFSAITVFLSTEEMVIVFRGTDDTLVGWKENFNMSRLDAVPAQRQAARYVDAVMARCPHSHVTLCGHSKGGNLAIYAAVHCREEYQSRIVHVYNNDGPGFGKSMMESPQYRQMQDRITTIIPQSSVVGRLLEHDERYTVVKSSANGLWQHNGFSWEVLGGHFVPEGELTRESRMIEQSLKVWIASMSEKEQEEFVEALYRFLTTTNATTLTELTSDRIWLLRLLRGSDAETKKKIFGGLAQLTGEAGKLWAETILPALRPKSGNPTAALETKNGEKIKKNESDT